MVENTSLDEVNSVVELNFPMSDVEVDVDIEGVVIIAVVVDIVIVVGADVSVEPGGLIVPSDVIDGPSVEVVGCVDETVEVSAGRGGIVSSVDIAGRVDVVVVEASVD